MRVLATRDGVYGNVPVYLLASVLLYGLFEDGKIPGRFLVNQGMQ